LPLLSSLRIKIDLSRSKNLTTQKPHLLSLSLHKNTSLPYEKKKMSSVYPPLIGSRETPSMETPSLSLTPSPVILTQDDLKKIAAYKAVEFVESGMVLGLGTGSTARHAVDRIADLIHQGKLKDIIGIPTSKITHEQALSLGIPLSDLDTHPMVDLAIDGADEVDPRLNLVKGRGGSLLREKMIEGACKRFVVIVDDSKLVDYVGGSGLAMPVEVVPFCWNFTLRRLKGLFKDSGCAAKLRRVGGDDAGEPFVTDNGNYIVDLYFQRDIGDLKVASDAMLRITGVVEHGMFIDMATTVIVAGKYTCCFCMCQYGVD
ncbi:Rib_5-P_isom_A domain-containing protein, partial [Cephalotus follicularis]